MLGLTDLYRDGIHASSAGQYAAAMATFSALYGVDPTGSQMPNYPYRDLPGYGTVLNPDGALEVQSIAWQTYQSVVAVPEPTSGVLICGILFWNRIRRNKHRSLKCSSN